jgi:hypothetical protein
MIDHPIEGEPDRNAEDRPADTPATIRLASRGRGPGIATILIAVFVSLALVKPWAGPPGAPRPTPRVTAAPTAAPSVDPLAELRRNCQEPMGWRIYSRERWAKMTVRSWKSFDPAYGASGPLDPQIPILPMGAQIEALGYCSPWTDGERPPADARVSGWRITSDRGVDAGSVAEPIALNAEDPRWPSVLGALYGPPVNRFDSTAVETLGWPGGRYVFAIRAPGFERWWGVEIEPPPPIDRTTPAVAPMPGVAPTGGSPASRAANP